MSYLLEDVFPGYESVFHLVVFSQQCSCRMEKRGWCALQGVFQHNSLSEYHSWQFAIQPQEKHGHNQSYIYHSLQTQPALCRTGLMESVHLLGTSPEIRVQVVRYSQWIGVSLVQYCTCSPAGLEKLLRLFKALRWSRTQHTSFLHVVNLSIRHCAWGVPKYFETLNPGCASLTLRSLMVLGAENNT